MLLDGVIYKLLKDKNVKIIYEVSDIHPLLIDTQKKFYNKAVSYMLRNLEQCLCKKVDLLVVTSEFFYEQYYKKMISSTRVYFFPNTPEPTVFKGFSRNNNNKFTVGFIGLIRYAKQLEMLIDLTKKCDIGVFIAGKGIESNRIENYSKGNDNVKIYGEYIYKSEIKKLYESVDCIYSVYDSNFKNVQIALPNKLYESVYTNTPIIVAKGTYLGEIVEKEKIGITIRSDNLKELEDAIWQIKNNQRLKAEIFDSTEKLKKIWKLEYYNSELINKMKDLGLI